MISMNSQLSAAEKIGELLAREGFLSREQLARSITAQKEEYPSVPLGKVCVALGFVSSSDLAGVLVKHRRHIHIGELFSASRTDSRPTNCRKCSNIQKHHTKRNSASFYSKKV